MLAGLKHFRHRRHDVIVLHVLDPAEIDFPFQHVTMFKGLEALGDVVTEPRSLRAAYQQRGPIVPEASPHRLPRPADRLPHGPHRPAARHRADGVPLGPQETSQVKMRMPDAGCRDSSPRFAPHPASCILQQCMHSSLALLAFGFGNLAMLGWLAAAAAPLLIHLWSRHRFREAPWAAMQFLLAAMRKNARRLQLQQWLLLAVRTLIIVLVVLAVAEPYGEQLLAGGSAAPDAQSARDRRLLLDGLSRRRCQHELRPGQAAGRASWSATAGRATSFTVILMAAPPRRSSAARSSITPPSPHKSNRSHAIAHRRRSRRRTDTRRSKHLRSDKTARKLADQTEVYFFTDLQRTTWANRPNPTQSAIRDSQSEMAVRLATLAETSLPRRHRRRPATGGKPRRHESHDV